MRSPTSNIPNTRPRRSTRRRGLTLIELMVAVAVLSAMIVAFGLIVSETQKVVIISEANMRSNFSAGAIEQVVRGDFRRISQDGFLCIDDKRVFFTTAGPSSSIVDSPMSVGSVVGVGICNNKLSDGTDDLTGTTNKILWHANWLLAKNSAPNGLNGRVQAASDIITTADLTDFKTMTGTAAVSAWIDGNVAGPNFVPVSLASPPVTLADIDRLWKVLADGVNDIPGLKISWTDGTVDPSDQNNLVWYDSAHPKNNPATVTETGTGATYRALWTSATPLTWPKAVRLRFKITDPKMPSEFRDINSGLDYEIICPITH